jgi:hypothetical protein
MPEHLRALVIILVLAAAVFWLAEKPMTASLMAVENYRRRRNLWFAVTLTAFLSHNFWLYSAITGAIAWHYGRRDQNPLALYILLLFAVPAFEQEIPGFGLINYIFDLNHVRLLNLVILLPMAVRFMQRADGPERPHRLADVLVGTYLLFVLAIQGASGTITAIIRLSFYLFIDFWLPYYVISRALRDMRAFREFAATCVLSISVIALVAMFEVARSWLLYEGLRGALNIHSEALMYLTRGDGGLLRALASVGGPITLGYLMMLGLGMLVFILPHVQNRLVRVLAVLALSGGLIAALSRGPWVGAVALLMVTLGIGHGAGKRIAWIVGGGGTALLLLLLSPLGQPIIDHLPFIGTVDEGNVVYRQRLLELSMLVLWQNPLFGAIDYIVNPLLEEMRTGLGIIDIVNTYLAVALGYGLVGVFLFVCPFVHSLWSTWNARRLVGAGNPEAERLGRVLLGCIVGILVTIGTVSSIGVVPTMYWLLVGACSAYVGMCRALALPPQTDGAPPAAYMRRRSPSTSSLH